MNEVKMRVGYLAPDFSINDKSNNLVSLSDFSGKVVLVEFWASWCSYCIAEIPTLNNIHSSYKTENFNIVGISLDTDASAWLNKIEAKNIEYIQLNDPAGFSSEVANAYEVSSIPKMVLIDEEGHILLITTSASEVELYLDSIFN